MKDRVRRLAQQSEYLFDNPVRKRMVRRWQQAAEQFYPERADFYLGDLKYGDNDERVRDGQITDYPSLVRRNLANQVSAMLRPRGIVWFHLQTQFQKINEAQRPKIWLEAGSERLRLILYNTGGGFVDSTDSCDNDLVTFGNGILQPTYNSRRDGLLWRNWHPRDVAWSEDVNGENDRVFRKQQMTIRDVIRYFRKANGEISPAVMKAVDDDPYKELTIQHIVVRSDEYPVEGKEYTGEESKNKRFPFRSIFIDHENETILEDVPARRLGYIIVKWGKIPGTQFGYSHASSSALGNARTLQRMALTLLEAGERAVDPALIVVGEAVQGGVNLVSGQMTYVSAEYDERTGEAVRTLPVDKGGLNWGIDRETRIREEIKEAFYLNQLEMPEAQGRGEQKTAYETQQRIEENIRRSLPLFEPFEAGYSAKVCESAFEHAMELNGFTDLLRQIPPELAGQEIKFTFESPLQAARQRANTQAFMQVSQVLTVASQLDPHIGADYDVRTATRDAVAGTQPPATWTLPEDQADANRKALADQAASAARDQLLRQGVQDLAQGAEAAQKAGGAMTALSQGAAGLPPQLKALLGGLGGGQEAQQGQAA